MANPQRTRGRVQMISTVGMKENLLSDSKMKDNIRAGTIRLTYGLKKSWGFPSRFPLQRRVEASNVKCIP